MIDNFQVFRFRETSKSSDNLYSDCMPNIQVEIQIICTLDIRRTYRLCACRLYIRHTHFCISDLQVRKDTYYLYFFAVCSIYSDQNSECACLLRLHSAGRPSSRRVLYRCAYITHHSFKLCPLIFLFPSLLLSPNENPTRHFLSSVL